MTNTNATGSTSPIIFWSEDDEEHKVPTGVVQPTIIYTKEDIEKIRRDLEPYYTVPKKGPDGKTMNVLLRIGKHLPKHPFRR